ncbi:hypothetical protein MBBA_0631 [Methanoculleus bourgensis]|uniref:hypothetical protein n=1 Tax=Methanoculleus bourgensis TaxID=83986 RepID=UPI0007BCAEFF|nr:hypothetical protein MBBA_0631 [Methanoculleus bourgensis]
MEYFQEARGSARVFGESKWYEANIMTSRMHTPHTTCPSCHEEVFLDELVGGRCPLCGYSLDEDDGTCSEYEETLERSDLGWMIFQFFVFKRFCNEGANPLHVMQVISRYEELLQSDPADAEKMRFTLEVPMRRWERLLPKRCSKCGRIFISGGKAMISGDLSSPEYPREYTCPAC